MLKFNRKIFTLISYIYIFLPLLIFLLGWLKIYFGIPLAVLLLYGAYISISKEEDDYIEISKDKFILILLGLFIIMMIVITSGIGASVKQSPDHLYRNSLYKTLVDERWPVIVNHNGLTKGLSYYIGFWLPAAVVGKLTNYQSGLLFQQIWALIGLVLLWYFICERKKKIHLWYLLAFLIFGGADYIGYLLTGKLFEQPGNRMEWWAGIYNYPGMLTSLFWVFNQAIYGWVITHMILREKNNTNLLFIWSASLLSCTLPAAGMIPFVIYKAINNTDSKNRFMDALKSCISKQNIIGFILCILFGIYLLQNYAVFHNLTNDNTGTLMVLESSYDSFRGYLFTSKLFIYLWFVLLEFGLYFIIIYPNKKTDSLYWLTLAVLMICPLIKVGYWIDFCLRASIPALVCLYHLVIDSLEDYYLQGRKALFICLIIMFAISGICCFDTLMSVMKQTVNNLYYEYEIPIEYMSTEILVQAENFFSSTDSLFYKIFAR